MMMNLMNSSFVSVGLCYTVIKITLPIWGLIQNNKKEREKLKFISFGVIEHQKFNILGMGRT